MGGAMGSFVPGKRSNRGIRLGIRVKGGTERNFGTVEALAFAFMFGFLPQPAVQIRKFKHNSDRKSKIPRSDTINPKELSIPLVRSEGNKASLRF
ncbi:hypothetical protein PBOR_03460 [Paenibacillus borealis]|uniref:Uncharacterized protein n=1 Tax=Paenibacillus borealis TaxID=160799 RepID=A0A089MHP8_PAEBO|nr:hypothetical protein PBOR_03460 [Paenibacillus borealis]